MPNQSDYAGLNLAEQMELFVESVASTRRVSTPDKATIARAANVLSLLLEAVMVADDVDKKVESLSSLAAIQADTGIDFHQQILELRRDLEQNSLEIVDRAKLMQAVSMASQLADPPPSIPMQKILDRRVASANGQR